MTDKPVRKRQTLDDMLDEAQPLSAEGDTEESAGPEVGAPRPTYNLNKTFSSTEVTTPRLTIAQGLSPDVRASNAQVGDFLLAGFDPEKSVTLVVVGIANTRRFVERDQQKARCWSPDGIKGFGNPGIACEECPFSKWGRDEAADKPIPPPCAEIDNWAVYSITHGMPVSFPLKGTAAKASRFIKNLCNGFGMGHFAIEVTSVSKQAGNRAWHEPLVKLNQEVSEDECIAYSAIAAKSFVAAPPVIPLEPVASPAAEPAPETLTADQF